MKLESCRICKNKKLETILDLGEMPLANAFLDKNQLDQKEIFYPLRVVWCESCGLLLIDEVVPPEILFRNYIYVSGTSEALRKHFEGLATEAVNNFKLNSESLVVDIGSNDGTLLKEFKKFGVHVLGVEPAVNIAKIAEGSGIKTINEFFSEDIAKKLNINSRDDQKKFNIKSQFDETVIIKDRIKIEGTISSYISTKSEVDGKLIEKIRKLHRETFTT